MKKQTKNNKGNKGEEEQKMPWRDLLANMLDVCFAIAIERKDLTDAELYEIINDSSPWSEGVATEMDEAQAKRIANWIADCGWKHGK